MRSDLMLSILLAFAAAGQPQPAESAAQAEMAISMELTRTEHGDAVISLAELATQANVSKEARKLYEKALQMERKGDAVRAEEHARAAAELAPAFFQAHAALAVAHLKAGNLDAADREIDIAQSLNPQYLPAHEIRGIIHFFRGDFREAALVLEALVKRAPCRDTARYFLVRALLKLGDVSRARYHLEMAETLGRDKGRRDFELSELGTGREGASFQEAAGSKTVFGRVGGHRRIP